MRRIILACALAGIFAMPAQAQSLRDQLVGAWALVSCDPNVPGFARACGTNPNGIHILDASGHYAISIALRGRPKASAGFNSPAEELKPLLVGTVTQFGTWSVDEAGKAIIHHIDGALFPNVEGEERRETVSVSGDELKIGQFVYRRIKR